MQSEKDLLFLLEKAFQQLLYVKEECVAIQNFPKATNYREMGMDLKRLIEKVRREEP